MQITLLARMGASRRISASDQLRPVNVGVPNGCSAISLAVSPSIATKATPSGLATRPRRMVGVYPARFTSPNAPDRSARDPGEVRLPLVGQLHGGVRWV